MSAREAFDAHCERQGVLTNGVEARRRWPIFLDGFESGAKSAQSTCTHTWANVRDAHGEATKQVCVECGIQVACT